MKLRSIAELEDAIDYETAWRRRELTTLSFEVRSASPKQEGYAVRAGVALLYAHWEGWIKNVASYYIEHVHQCKLKYDELAQAFLGTALRARLAQFGESNAASVQVEFAQFLQKQMGTRATLRADGAVRTESNLSSSVLRDIAMRLGVSYAPYELNENLIDESLVRARNRIAHGEYETPDATDFESLYQSVLRMLNAFTVDVLNAAATRAYRRNP